MLIFNFWFSGFFPSKRGVRGVTPSCLLRGVTPTDAKATLPHWFELSHDYVGLAVTEIIYGPVGLIRTGFSTVGLFLGRKSKISQEQNVKEFQFYIRMPNFRLLGSIIKKKYLNVADPLKAK